MSLGVSRRVGVTAALLLMMGICLLSLLAAGHPFLAGWFAVASFALLFIAGASMAGGETARREQRLR